MHEEAEKMPAPQSNRPLNPERDNYNVDKITECWKCSAKFSSRKLLVRHLKEHNIDFPFKCYLCDASFETRKECLYHQERVHCDDWPQLREKNRVDDIEGFSEAMEELVAKNYRGGDPDANDLSDVVAGEEAAIDAATSDYIQRKVYCSLCPKRFWSLQDLRRHMRSHTGMNYLQTKTAHQLSYTWMVRSSVMNVYVWLMSIVFHLLGNRGNSVKGVGLYSWKRIGLWESVKVQDSFSMKRFSDFCWTTGAARTWVVYPSRVCCTIMCSC